MLKTGKCYSFIYEKHNYSTIYLLARNLALEKLIFLSILSKITKITAKCHKEFNAYFDTQNLSAIL